MQVHFIGTVNNSMPRILLLGVFLCFLSGLCFAKSWSGALVDSKCYQYEELNVNPSDTLTSVDRDGRREVTFCSPSKKTKSFAVVQQFGPTLTLDSTGNTKAAELVRKIGKKSLLVVVVTGETDKSTIKVDAISITE